MTAAAKVVAVREGARAGAVRAAVERVEEERAGAARAEAVKAAVEKEVEATARRSQPNPYPRR